MSYGTNAFAMADSTEKPSMTVSLQFRYSLKLFVHYRACASECEIYHIHDKVVYVLSIELSRMESITRLIVLLVFFYRAVHKSHIYELLQLTWQVFQSGSRFKLWFESSSEGPLDCELTASPCHHHASISLFLQNPQDPVKQPDSKQRITQKI